MWSVEVDGSLWSETFASEDEANQAAANARGNDWGKRIVVREVVGKTASGKQPTESKSEKK